MDINDIDSAVCQDAAKMLERAAKCVDRLSRADTATTANREAAQKLLSEALANIHAAEARLK